MKHNKIPRQYLQDALTELNLFEDYLDRLRGKSKRRCFFYLAKLKWLDKKGIDLTPELPLNFIIPVEPSRINTIAGFTIDNISEVNSSIKTIDSFCKSYRLYLTEIMEGSEGKYIDIERFNLPKKESFLKAGIQNSNNIILKDVYPEFQIEIDKINKEIALLYMYNTKNMKSNIIDIVKNIYADKYEGKKDKFGRKILSKNKYADIIYPNIKHKEVWSLKRFRKYLSTKL